MLNFSKTGTIWYDTKAVRPDYDRPIIHVVYYWMYTLTTVGFETPIDLKSELKHVYQLVLLRIFGLAFLAGVVDSVAVYVDYRREQYVKNRTKTEAFNFPEDCNDLDPVDQYEEEGHEEDDIFAGNFPHYSSAKK